MAHYAKPCPHLKLLMLCVFVMMCFALVSSVHARSNHAPNRSVAVSLDKSVASSSETGRLFLLISDQSEMEMETTPGPRRLRDADGKAAP